MRKTGSQASRLFVSGDLASFSRSVHIDLHGGRSSVSGVVATVFGGSGFVGRYVINRLGKIGSQVIVPYRGEEYGVRHLKLLGDLGQVVPMWYNVRNKESVKRAMQHSNIVINLVGKHWETRNFPFYDVNVESAATIASAAKECGVERLIHVSCAGADPSSPSGYSKSKAFGEQVVRDIFPEATILRPCVLFGRQDFFLHKYAFINSNWPLALRVCKDHKVQPLWVSDLATALMNALANPDSAGKTYDLGGPAVLTIEEVTDFVSEILLSKKPWIDVPQPVMIAMSSIWEKMLRLPRYTPDEIVFMGNHDSIVPPDSHNALQDLGVAKPASIQDIALSYLRSYRIPAYQNLVD